MAPSLGGQGTLHSAHEEKGATWVGCCFLKRYDLLEKRLSTEEHEQRIVKLEVALVVWVCPHVAAPQDLG